MNNQAELSYMYLDTEQDRRKLLQEIEAVRRDVLALVEATPESEYYTPRYHGWSLAAMLGHLNMADSMSMFLIRASLVGMQPNISEQTLHRMNDFFARLFQKRVVETSCKSIVKNQERIHDLIINLPMDRFSRPVNVPLAGQLTVEKALQYLFLFHWQHHLQELRTGASA